ncbi:MAG: hypothetical protein WDO68_22060 [Gammaproteobacteria bacterium]
MKSLMAIVLAVSTLMLLSCGLRSQERSWQEEVRLSDGQIVRAERRERYRTGSEIGGTGGDMQRESAELRVTLASGHQLPVLKIGDGKNSELLMVFDVAQESGPEYFAVTMVDHEYQVKEAGLDIQRPYFEYRLLDGVWSRGRVLRARLGHKSNLLISRSLVAHGGLISISSKEEADSDPGIYAEYKCVRGPRC